MSLKDTGGPAFPSSNTPDHGFYAEGMTLRDFFAAMVIGHLAVQPDSSTEDDAAYAYIVADEMLKERMT